MKRSRLVSLLCLFALVALFSATSGMAAEKETAPTSEVMAAPAQSPASSAPALPDFLLPANPGTDVPQWQPMTGCTLVFCNLCTQSGGICRYTGGQCVCN